MMKYSRRVPKNKIPTYEGELNTGKKLKRVVVGYEQILPSS